MAQLDAPSDWRPGGGRFNPRQVRQHSFVEIDHEIFSVKKWAWHLNLFSMRRVKGKHSTCLRHAEKY